MAQELQIVIKAKDEASGTLSALHGKASGLGSMLGGALKAGAIGGGVALAGLGTASLKMAMDFEKSFAEVKTLLPQVSEQGFKKLQGDLLDFSKEMGIATDKAIPALYQAISSGVPADNVMTFMETAAKLSIGGVTSLETAVDGLSSVVNAYGANVLGAGKASDIMFTAVKLGKTTADELSASLFNVVPTAASLGITFEEVAAAMATMTVQGVPTSVATTQLRQAFVEASKGGTLLDKAIRELSGKSFAELVKSGKTGASILEELRQSMPEQEFKDLFGSVEAMNAVLQITGPNAKLMEGNLAAMGGAAGATDKAFKTMAETASFKLNKILNELKVTLLEVGLKALPYLVKGLEFVVGAISSVIEVMSSFIQYLRWVVTEGDTMNDWLTHLPEPLRGVVKVFGDVVLFIKDQAIPALIDLGVILAKFAEDYIKKQVLPALATLKQGWDDLQPVLKTVAGWLKDHVVPVLKTVAEFLLDHKEIIIALAAYILFLIQPWLAVAAVIVLVLAKWDEIKALFTKTIPAAIDSVITKIKELPIIGEIFQAAFDAALLVVKTMFGIIKIEVETAINAVRDIIKIVTALIHGDWDEAWKGVKQLVVDIWDGIWGIVDLQIKAIKGLLKVEIDLIVGILGDAWDLAEGKVKSIWKDIKEFLEGAANGVKQFFKDNWPEIATIISGPFAPLVLLATDAFGVRSALEGAMTAAKQWVSDRIDDIVGFFEALPGRVASTGNDMLISFRDAAVAGWLTVKSWFEALPGKLLESIGDLFALGWGIGKAFISGIGEAIRDGLGWLAEQAGKIPGAILGALGDLPGLSPSPMGLKIGKAFIEGISIGIDEMSPSLIERLAKLADDMYKAVKEALIEKLAKLADDIAKNAAVQGGTMGGGGGTTAAGTGVATGGGAAGQTAAGMIEAGTATQVLVKDASGNLVGYQYFDANGNLIGETDIQGVGSITTPGLQHGGIVRRPTLLVAGEVGPEAIVPLGSGGGGLGPPITVTIAVSTIDPRSFLQWLRSEGGDLIQSELRRRGALVAV